MQLFKKENQTMSSMEIAELTGKRHDNVMSDIRKMLNELGLNAPDFSGTQKYGNNNERQIFNLTKDLTETLVSGYNVRMRYAIVKRWNELEERASSNPLNLPTDYPSAMRALATEHEKSSELQLQAEINAPKVLLANALTSDGCRPVRLWVKMIKDVYNFPIGERAVFKWLVQSGFIFKYKGKYLPIAKYESNGRGYFIMDGVLDSKGKMRMSLKITDKGVSKLTPRIISELSPDMIQDDLF